MAEPVHVEAKKRYKRLFSEVRALLNEADPIGLIAMGAPDDEYEPEVGTILPRLPQATSVEECQAIIDSEFDRWFSPEIVGGWKASTSLAEKVLKAWPSYQDAS